MIQIALKRAETRRAGRVGDTNELISKFTIAFSPEQTIWARKRPPVTMVQTSKNVPAMIC